MRKRNGYTFIDMLVVIVALGLVTLFTVPKLSHAFENDKDTLYDESLELYLNQATKYGNTIKNEVKENLMRLFFRSSRYWNCTNFC